MFNKTIDYEKLTERSLRFSNEMFYSRLHWDILFLPMIKMVFDEVSDENKSNKMYLTVASEGLKKEKESYEHVTINLLKNASINFPLKTLNEIEKQAKEFSHVQKEAFYGDSTTIFFGNKPLWIRPTVEAPHQKNVLSEIGARLSISQHATGMVLASVYLPESKILGSSKSSYIIAKWSDPAHITRKKIKKLINNAYQVNLFCSAQNYPNKKGSKLIISLMAKDETILEGTNRLWVWFKYTFKVVRGVLKMYGLDIPSK